MKLGKGKESNTPMASRAKPKSQLTSATSHLDRVDRQILRTLQKDGRIAISELARTVHLTTTPCYERVKRLERDGYIRGYTALLNAKSLGAGLLVFVEVCVDRTTPDIMARFQATIQRFDEVLECHTVAGNFDYLIKVRVEDMNAFGRFLSEKLIPAPGIMQTRTYVVIAEIKCSAEVII
jgi:Lrp/AsnC family leucine-responsive transcriptional regulator